MMYVGIFSKLEVPAAIAVVRCVVGVIRFQKKDLPL